MKGENMEIYKEFGRRLCEIRKRKGYTQAEAARRMGTVQSTYSAYELGNRHINLELVYKLAKALEISPKELFVEAETMMCPETAPTPGDTDELLRWLAETGKLAAPEDATEVQRLAAVGVMQVLDAVFPEVV